MEKQEQERQWGVLDESFPNSRVEGYRLGAKLMGQAVQKPVRFRVKWEAWNKFLKRIRAEKVSPQEALEALVELYGDGGDIVIHKRERPKTGADYVGDHNGK